MTHEYGKRRTMLALGGLPGVSHALGEVAARLRRSLVLVRGRRSGSGSGVIWRADGIILTNDHVVHGEGVQVTLADGRQLEAHVVGRDKTLDLAALRVAGSNLPTAPVGN